MQFGIRINLTQFLQLLLQVLLVGMTIGMMRNVVPALAESEFGVPRGSFMLLVAFVVAFGFVKGAMNFVAGRMAEVMGRKRVLVLGWLVALPIPLLVYFATSWSWVVLATILLGINQGLTWSMTQTAKLDMTRADQRGLVIGLNEFSGYVGVALAGVATGYLASMLGPRQGLLWFGSAVIGLATMLAWLSVVETLPWAHDEMKRHRSLTPASLRPRYPTTVVPQPDTAEMFALMSWRDRRMAALSLAGMVEKFVDALVWAFWPVYLHQRGVSLPGIGWIVGVYGFTWCAAQLFTGKLSDRVGRHLLITFGMWICGVDVALMPLRTGSTWWSGSAAIAGLGMAMLYPNLSAAVADIAHPNWRASAIGMYRFWRDLGYGIGGMGLGLTAALGGGVQSAFWFVAGAMFLSGLLLYIWGEETHPRLNPVD
ncbi:MFS transporter [Paraburkholderia sp. CNPSo 3157]|uniref:MFS transporter n=1 Tax=Paraburkholderia franconis TaxID=2654983 RepID=A0A7X1TDN9_9BURK|nr:MFS transporter [Paraburkholderia franconis]MPW15508.1 MFS transporter [Paraburkholderia franconis]